MEIAVRDMDSSFWEGGVTAHILPPFQEKVSI